MKLTLDKMCIQSGRLCNTCKTKMKNGEISNEDITVGKIIIAESKAVKSLNEITLIKLISTDTNVYIIMKKGSLDIMKQAGYALQDKIEDVLQKNVYYIEKTRNKKQFLENILHPVVPISNSEVLLPPDGDKKMKIQIKRSDKNKIPIDVDELSLITQYLFNMPCFFSYV